MNLVYRDGLCKFYGGVIIIKVFVICQSFGDMSLFVFLKLDIFGDGYMLFFDVVGCLSNCYGQIIEYFQQFGVFVVFGCWFVSFEW